MISLIFAQFFPLAFYQMMLEVKQVNDGIAQSAFVNEQQNCLALFGDELSFFHSLGC